MIDGVKIHSEVVIPWKSLKAAAAAEGFDLVIASGFRSFERQLMIWNDKLLGNRVILDDQGRPLDFQRLPPFEQVKSVMRWSALPGASRHHWGTDMDVYDAAAVPDDYTLQLIPDEYRVGGPFAPCMFWLDEYLSRSDLGFFFPYSSDTSGVMPEPWHLSYRPVASQFQQKWLLDSLIEIILESDIQHKTVILEHMSELYHQFIEEHLSTSDCLRQGDG